MKSSIALSMSVLSIYLIAAEQSLSLEQKFAAKVPTKWAEIVPGVKIRFTTTKKEIALTLDACGGKDGCDYRILNFLIENAISATIFVTGKWITEHSKDFAYICTFPHLFAIENHGARHRPCSVNGASIYGIQGTRTIKELVEEVEDGAHLIHQLTGKKPRYYRSGTAYYDDIAVQIVDELGYQVIGFSILGDAGTTFDHDQAAQAVASATPGTIIIAHMNHPEKSAGAGVIEGLKRLQQQGYHFVLLTSNVLT
jgi:peptidoglycan/xylan/chitin deacetylase (PgdA/CDA1 family)